jgi:uncharacterized membrane protein YidH (DUF202 family)
MLGFKFTIGLLVVLAGAAAIGLGYQKYKFVLKMIFGKERLKKQGKDTLGFYLYIIGGILVFLGLMIMF